MVTTEILTRRRLNRATLARQMLLERATGTPVATVVRLAGMQAQEPAPPFVGLWTRLAGFDSPDLLAALHARTIVRCTAMRGTLHLLASDDYRAWRGPREPGIRQALSTLGSRAVGLDPDAVLAAADALFAERPRTFNDLRDALAAAFPGVDARALGHVARMGLPLVMVPGGVSRWGFPADPVFGLAEDWLGPVPPNDDAARAMALRYLGAFGPASATDFGAWSGLKGTKALFEKLRPGLVAFRDERGREVFDVPDAPRPDPETPAPPRFLPAFDNILLAHDDRSRIIADAHRPRVVTKNLRVHPTFLWDGVVAGTWKPERTRVAATLRLMPFSPLPAGAADALAAEGEALLHFVEPDAPARTVAFEPSG